MKCYMFRKTAAAHIIFISLRSAALWLTLTSDLPVEAIGESGFPPGKSMAIMLK